MTMGHVCPWWHAYTFDNPLRRLLHNPSAIVGEHVGEGMRVLDLGCGMGFFSIAMARMVGDSGLVIAVDLQQKMLDVLMRRATRAGVAARIRPHRCDPDGSAGASPSQGAVHSETALIGVAAEPLDPRRGPRERIPETQV